MSESRNWFLMCADILRGMERNVCSALKINLLNKKRSSGLYVKKSIQIIKRIQIIYLWTRNDWISMAKTK